MGGSHLNSFAQADTTLVEGKELQLSSLVQSHLLSQGGRICLILTNKRGDRRQAAQTSVLE